MPRYALVLLLAVAGGPEPQETELQVKARAGLSLEKFRELYVSKRSYAGPLNLDLSRVEHLDLIERRIKPKVGASPLQERERGLLARNGFALLSRSYPSFGSALHDVYRNDQPLFVTTDAILHAVHKSFGEVLSEIETAYLAPLLSEILEGTLRGARDVQTEFAGDAVISGAADDIAFMVEVARALLARGPAVSPRAARALRHIASEEPGEVEFLGRGRVIDFSQFKPRGHYARTDELQAYFRAVMWLGREDLAFRIGESFREAVAAFVLAEAMLRGGVFERWEKFDRVVSFFAGRPDGATPRDLRDFLRAAGFANLGEFARKHEPQRVLKAITQGTLGEQKILSAIITKAHPGAPRLPLPRTAQLLGQRFAIDAFIFHHVTYDRTPAMRLMPSPLDVMGALGSPRAMGHLVPELARFSYQDRLAGVADAVAALPARFWERDLYHDWLATLRELSADTTAQQYAPVFRTDAWADLKLQTQLASWAQLRHDTLLYVKQSYTLDVPCEFCDVYVEPYPAFFERLRAMMDRAAAALPPEERQPRLFRDRIQAYRSHFRNFAATMERLARIAQKELEGRAPDAEERRFLKEALEVKETDRGCVSVLKYNGWYPRLFLDPEECAQWDPTIADVHTQPSDKYGVKVGRVLHAATGAVRMAAVVVRGHDGSDRAYLAPLMSYHELVTEDFRRLNDKEWKQRAAGPLEVPSHSPPQPKWLSALLPDAPEK
jgi:hypothetical protein